MTDNSDEESEAVEQTTEESDKGVGLLITRGLRLWGAALFGIILIAALSLIAAYLVSGTTHLEPAKLDLVNLVIFCSLGLVLCLLPWEGYQVNVKKIGPFQFTKLLSAQAKERESELTEVWEAIEELKKARSPVAGKDEKTEVPFVSNEPEEASELEKLLGEFLEAYPTTAFSTTRIKSIEPKKFKDYKPPEMRRALRKMVASGDADTRVSRKTGNTLYKLN